MKTSTLSLCALVCIVLLVVPSFTNALDASKHHKKRAHSRTRVPTPEQLKQIDAATAKVSQGIDELNKNQMQLLELVKARGDMLDDFEKKVEAAKDAAVSDIRAMLFWWTAECKKAHAMNDAVFTAAAPARQFLPPFTLAVASLATGKLIDKAMRQAELDKLKKKYGIKPENQKMNYAAAAAIQFTGEVVAVETGVPGVGHFLKALRELAAAETAEIQSKCELTKAEQKTDDFKAAVSRFKEFHAEYGHIIGVLSKHIAERHKQLLEDLAYLQKVKKDPNTTGTGAGGAPLQVVLTRWSSNLEEQLTDDKLAKEELALGFTQKS